AVLGQPLFRIGCRLGLVFDDQDAHGRRRKSRKKRKKGKKKAPELRRLLILLHGRPWRSVALRLGGFDIDAHAVVKDALGRNLGEFEWLEQAVESPGEFLLAGDDLHDLAVFDVDELGAGGDDNRALRGGGLRRLAVEVAEGERAGRKARGGKGQCCQSREKQFHGILHFGW